MSDHFNEYHMQHHFEERRNQLMEEARQHRLKNEMLKAARLQKQARPVVLPVPNPWARLRAALRLEAPRPIVPDCTSLESTTS